MKLIKTLSLSLAAMLGLSIGGVVLAELPQISDARVVQPPPGAKVAAAYFTITNPGTVPLEITNASSDIARQVEIHLSVVENDVAMMRKQDSVVVPAGESLKFKHGSYHVMFMGLNEKLVAGNSLDLVLETTSGDLPVSVPVISLIESTSMGDMKHDMNDMNDMKNDMNIMKHEMPSTDK